MNRILKRFVGSRSFYKSVLTLLVPIIIQQFISSFVSLLDNVMVGSLGTEAISAASIANQVMMVYNLAIFGGLSGVSIFGAQYYGKGDMDGMRNTFRIKISFAVGSSVLAIAVYLLAGESFIASFLMGESNGGDMGLALREGVVGVEEHLDVLRLSCAQLLLGAREGRLVQQVLDDGTVVAESQIELGGRHGEDVLARVCVEQFAYGRRTEAIGHRQSHL